MFSCRYCDFVVHEVAEDGGVVKLTNYSLPIEVNEVSVCVYVCVHISRVLL